MEVVAARLELARGLDEFGHAFVPQQARGEQERQPRRGRRFRPRGEAVEIDTRARKQSRLIGPHQARAFEQSAIVAVLKKHRPRAPQSHRVQPFDDPGQRARAREHRAKAGDVVDHRDAEQAARQAIRRCWA